MVAMGGERLQDDVLGALLEAVARTHAEVALIRVKHGGVDGVGENFRAGVAEADVAEAVAEAAEVRAGVRIAVDQLVEAGTGDDDEDGFRGDAFAGGVDELFLDGEGDELLAGLDGGAVFRRLHAEEEVEAFVDFLAGLLDDIGLLVGGLLLGGEWSVGERWGFERRELDGCGRCGFCGGGDGLGGCGG